MRNIFWFTFLVFLSVALGQGLSGCANLNDGDSTWSPFRTPEPLKDVAKGLNGLILLGVVAVASGVGLYFFSPVGHTLSFTIAGVGATLEATALITRVSLGFVPWVAGSLLLGGGIALIYEIYSNRAALFNSAKTLI